ncbi:MAG: GyrI-like domain-containing protein [Clostridia bacterium]|nr:GyrI-like domain-containing protein [Clostridia bacterium]
MQNYKIVTKPQFTVMGYSQKFNSQTSYEQIPKFWTELLGGESKTELCGMYGICYNCKPNGNFDYMIADDYVPIFETADKAEILIVPAHTWAVFSCVGKLPKSLQDLNTYIFNDWLPNNKQYSMVDDLSIEAYFDTEDNNSDEAYSEIWIPIEKI